MDSVVVGIRGIFRRGKIPSIEPQKAESEHGAFPKSGTKRLGQGLSMG